MSYHTEMHLVFIFIVPLIFIAPTPPSIVVLKIGLEVCMKILLLPYSLLHMNSIRYVVYHKTSSKEGRCWIFFVLSHLRKQLLSSYIIQEMCYGVFHLFPMFLIY